MEEFLKSYVDKQEEDLAEKALNHFNENKEQYISNLFNCFYVCEQQANILREKGLKTDTVSITISFMLTSLMTKQYELKIDAFDTNGALDLAECSSYYSYEYLGKVYEELTNSFEKTLREKFTRIKKYELDILTMRYHTILFNIIKYLLNTILIDEECIDKLFALNLSKLSFIGYGYYLNKQELLVEMM